MSGEILEEGIENLLTGELSNKEDEVETLPKDKYHLTFILFYVMGTLVALPDHFLLTATDYWNYKFRNMTSPEAHKTQLQTQFFSISNAVSITVGVITLFVSIKLAGVVSVPKRLIISMLTMLIAFGITLFFTKIDTDSWQYTFYIISIANGALLRASGSAFLIPCMQLAWKFPPAYLAGHVTGRSICGTLGALTQILALGVTTDSLTTGFVYFSISFIWVILTISMYIFVLRSSEFFKKLSVKISPPIEGNQFSKEVFKSVLKKLWAPILAMCLIMVGSSAVHPGVTSLIQSVNPGTPFTVESLGPWGEQVNSLVVDNSSTFSSDRSHSFITHNVSTTIQRGKAASFVRVQGGHSYSAQHWDIRNDKFFVSVTTYLQVTLFDVIGREIARKYTLNIKPTFLVIIGLMRLIIFVPLILLCNIQPRQHLPVIFNNDYIYIILMMLFALTEGYFGNLCILLIPACITPREAKLGIALVIASMVISVAIFSYVSIIIVKLI